MMNFCCLVHNLWLCRNSSWGSSWSCRAWLLSRACRTLLLSWASWSLGALLLLLRRASLSLWRNEGFVSLTDHSSVNSNSLDWQLKEVSSGWSACFNDFPLLLQSNLVNNSLLLINVDLSNDWDLCVVELRDVDVVFLGGQDLLDHGVVDLRNADEILNGRSILRHVNVPYHWEVNGMFNGLRFKSVDWSFHWEDK